MQQNIPILGIQNIIASQNPQYGATLITPDIQDYDQKLKGYTAEYTPFGDSSALFDGLKISPVGTWVRKGLNGSLSPLSKYTPANQEQLQEIGKATGWNSDDMEWVLDGASSMQEVRGNLDILAQNKRIQEQFNASSWYMSLVGGLGSSLGNPVDIATTVASFVVPPIGTVAKFGTAGVVATRIGVNTASGVAANQFQSYVSGVNHELWTDVANMLALTTGIEGIKRVNKSLLTTRNKIAIAHDQLLKNGKVSPQLAGTYAQKIANATLGYAQRMNDVRQQLTSGLPTIQYKQQLKKLIEEQDEDASQFASKFTHFEQGVRSQKNDGISKQYVNNGQEPIKQKGGVSMPTDSETTLRGSGKTTLFEQVRNLGLKTAWARDWLPNAVSNVSKRFTRVRINEFLYRKVQGYDTTAFGQMNKDTQLLQIAQKLKKGYQEQGKLLINHGLVDNIFGYRGYLPMIVDKYKMSDFIKRMGGDQNAGKALQKYLYNGVVNDATTMGYFKQIFQKQMKQAVQKAKKQAAKKGRNNYVHPSENWSQQDWDVQYNKWLWDQSGKSSYGYRDQNRTQNKSDNFDDNAVGFSFRKRRLPWNAGYRQNGFSLMDLRADVVDATQRYTKRTNGLVADTRVFGMDFEGVAGQINHITNVRWVKADREPKFGQKARTAMDVLHRRAYGLPINPNKGDYNIGDALSDILRNLSYGAYGTLMGVLSYGEVATALQAYGASTLLKMMPGAEKLFNKFARNDFTPEEFKVLKQHLIGREAAQRLNIRQIMRSQQERLKDLNPYIARAVGLSRVFADYSAGSFVMEYSNDTIIDTIQSQFLRQFANRAFSKTYKKRGFMRPQDLKRLNIPDEDLLYAFRVFKRHAYQDADGIVRLKDNFEQITGDDRAMYVMRRLINYVAEETLQRRGLDDVFTWQYENNPILALAMQFKTFAIQSYNKRLVKLMNRIEDEGALGAVNNYLISSVLTAAVTSAQAYLRTLGMSEEDRNRYLKNVFGVDLDQGLDSQAVANIVFNTMFNRNPYTASLALVSNTLGIGTGAKTTASTPVSIGDQQQDTGFISPMSVTRTVSDMFPSLRILDNIVGGAVGTLNYAQDSYTDQFTAKERRATAKQLNSALGILPTIPGATNIFKGYVKQSLEDYQYGY